MKKDKLEVLSINSLTNTQGALFGYLEISEDGYDLLEAQAVPLLLEDGMLLICLDGEAEIVLDTNKYLISRNTLSIAFAYTTFQTISRSNDFRGMVLAINSDFARQLQLAAINSNFIFIRENPCIVLSESDKLMFKDFIGIVKNIMGEDSNCYKTEILNNLIAAMTYKIAAIYADGQIVSRQKLSRQDIIFQRFLNALPLHYKEHRDVKFYAEKAFVTTRHFSVVINEISGRTPAQWIAEMVILQAKRLLTYTNMTISQISDDFNFPNASFFGRYFKRHVGLSPKAYRSE